MAHHARIVGITALQKKLQKNADMAEVKQLVREHGSAMQTKAQYNAPVGTPESTGIPGYVGGTLKRSIRQDIKDDGLTSEVSANTDYAGYVEWGTRYMNAQPYMRPAYNDQKEKFKKDLDKLTE